MKQYKILLFFLTGIFFFLLFQACTESEEPEDQEMEEEEMEEEMPQEKSFYLGADLSYVNEMEDCGAVYKNADGTSSDPYEIFAEAGTDIVRVRLWHNPDWTDYSDFDDIKETISRAKAEGMEILLDFHYSDDWADPGKQKVPAAWRPVVNNILVLADSVYNYTYKVLEQLYDANLLPEYVQVGNEINSEILQDPDRDYNEINWDRNAGLINSGIAAVREASINFGKDIKVMLHIAQPENAIWWFHDAVANGITDFDWIGISYYPAWSSHSLDQLSAAISELISTYSRDLMVVETAYPYTLDNADAANNILGNDALVSGYPATQQGQLDFLKALKQSIADGGGKGMIYWEPAWVSTGCQTQWGTGSHWDNATLFDHNNQAILGMNIYGE